jgi:hypothetical protein
MFSRAIEESLEIQAVDHLFSKDVTVYHDGDTYDMEVKSISYSEMCIELRREDGAVYDVYVTVTAIPKDSNG